MSDIVTSMIKTYLESAKTNEDKNRLQEDLESLDKWSSTWQIRFNAEKCKVMDMDNKNSQYEYNMISENHRVILESTECNKKI